MFKENKYTKYYYLIIERRKSNPLDENEYGEKHHIIPNSLNGSDELDNIVKVSFREHFVLHLLLTKMCIDPLHDIKMKWALHRISFSSDKKLNSHEYELARKIHRRFLSENHHSKRIPDWNKKMSDVVKKSWENADERRKKIGEVFKKHWKPKYGSDNGMYGKISPKRGKKFPGTGSGGSSNSQAKHFVFEDVNNNIVYVDDLKMFSNSYNLSYQCMVSVSIGRNKQHKGYKLLYKSNQNERRVGE